MGSAEEIVVLRGGLPLEAVSGGALHIEVAGSQELSGGWRAVSLLRSAYDEQWLREVMRATGNPVLLCTITSMDAAFARGLSRSGLWQGWLNTTTSAEELASSRFEQLDPSALFDEGGQEAIDDAQERLLNEAENELLESWPQLARSAAQWADDAGHNVEVGPILALLSRTDQHFGRPLFFSFLSYLGITEEADTAV